MRNFKFKDKTIVIISPQSWGKMHISKHHYAIELAKKNTVFFINPPQKSQKKKIVVENNEFENLQIISYRLFFPSMIRFHWRKLHDFLFALQIKYILKNLKIKVDILWNFDTNLITNLKIFNAQVSIYHVVDNVAGDYQLDIIKSSDVVFYISEEIADNLKNSLNVPMYFINHGLNKYFSDKAKNYKPVKKRNTTVKAAYVGNLLAVYDRNVFKKIISDNFDLEFYFWGAYSNDMNNLGSDETPETKAFISFLQQQKNVTLKGAVSPKRLSEEMQEIDVFISADEMTYMNKGSNSHKILEYLSTGKVIVSNHISTYFDKRYLIEMVDEMHNNNLPTLFKKVISNLEYYNSPEMQKKRIEFALDNTYEKQIERIEHIVNKTLNYT